MRPGPKLSACLHETDTKITYLLIYFPACHCFFYRALSSMRCYEAESATETSLKCIVFTFIPLWIRPGLKKVSSVERAGSARFGHSIINNNTMTEMRSSRIDFIPVSCKRGLNTTVRCAGCLTWLWARQYKASYVLLRLGTAIHDGKKVANTSFNEMN